MKIAICDDEPSDLGILRSLVRQYDAKLDVSEFPSAKSLLEAYEQSFFDLVFLDIEMNEPNGFEIAQILMQRSDKPLIVFVSNSSEYTLRGYGIAFRYLKKPISYDSMSHVLGLAIEHIVPQKITITVKGQTMLLSVQEIYYVEVINHNIEIHTKSGLISFRGQLKDIEAALPKTGFAKPHNSYIVNLAEVRSMDTKNLDLMDGTVIPISQRNRKAFEKALFQFIRR